MSPSARACAHCGLATASAGAYCCYGCELAGRIAAEGRDQRSEHYAVITFSLRADEETRRHFNNSSLEISDFDEETGLAKEGAEELLRKAGMRE